MKRIFKSINYIQIIKLILGGFLIIGSIITLIIANGNNIVIDNASLIKTGVIVVNSIPEDADIYIDNVLKGTTKNEITNVTTGNLEIKLVKDGFTSWSKLIDVKENEITKIQVQLYPNKLNLTQIIQLPIENITFDNDRILYIVNDKNTSLSRIIWEFKKNEGLLGRDNSSKLLGTIPTELNSVLITNNYSISAKDYTILINDSLNNENYLLDLNNLTKYKKVSNLLGKKENNIELYNSNKLLIKAPNLVYTVDISTEEKKLITLVDENTVFSNNTTQFIYQNPVDKSLNLTDGGFVEKIVSFEELDKISKKNADDIKKQDKNTDTEYTDKDIAYFNLLKDVLSSLNKIYMPAKTSNILILKDNFNLFLWDRNSKHLEKIAESTPQSEIVTISNNGNTVIFKKDSEIYTFEFEKIPLTSSYRSKTTKIENINSNSNITLSESANNIIIQTLTEDNKNTIEIADTDGKNKIQVLTDTEILNNKFNILSDQRGMYITLNSSIDQLNKNFNIFEVSLIK